MERHPTPEEERGERDEEVHPSPQTPPVVITGDRDDGSGPIRRWWVDPSHRRLTAALLGIVLFAGVVWWVGRWIEASPPPGASASGGTNPPPAVVAFQDLQDSLTARIEGYEARLEDVGTNAATCSDLAVAYRQVDSLFVAAASRYQNVRNRLSSERRSRHRALFDRITEVNRSFDQSGCPRPE